MNDITSKLFKILSRYAANYNANVFGTTTLGQYL